MKAQSFFEQNGGTCIQVGDYYISDLKDDEPGHCSIGKKPDAEAVFTGPSSDPVLRADLVGKLYQHLTETDHARKKRVELISRQVKGQAGVTEALKATAKWNGFVR